MSKHGGNRKGSGRKPKADEFKLIEAMDKTMPIDEVLIALSEKIIKRDIKAIDLWMKYRLGMPKQSIDHTNDGDKFEGIKPIEWVKGKE